jgi:LPXTG-motif cell wall-anchored protein
VVYIEEIALFADQASAYAYAGTEPETEAPTEETEAPTDAPETEAPTAEDTTAAEKSGCGSALGGSVLLLLGGAAWILRKRKHE